MTLFGLVVLPMKLFGNLNNLGRVRRHDNRVMDMPTEPPPRLQICFRRFCLRTSSHDLNHIFETCDL